MESKRNTPSVEDYKEVRVAVETARNVLKGHAGQTVWQVMESKPELGTALDSIDVFFRTTSRQTEDARSLFAALGHVLVALNGHQRYVGVHGGDERHADEWTMKFILCCAYYGRTNEGKYSVGTGGRRCQG
jgi:hypothetical protein